MQADVASGVSPGLSTGDNTMITVCAILDRSWVLPAAFCLFAFAGFADAFSYNDCSGEDCLYECMTGLPHAISAATKNAPSTEEWGFGEHTWTKSVYLSDTTYNIAARCASVGNKETGGRISVCKYHSDDPHASSVTYSNGVPCVNHVFVEKEGTVKQWRGGINPKNGIFLKFEVQKNGESKTSRPFPASLGEHDGESICRLCTPRAINDDCRIYLATESLRNNGALQSDDGLWKDFGADSAVEWLAMHAVDNDDATIKVSVVAKDGSGKEVTSELFSLPLKGAGDALDSLWGEGPDCRQYLADKILERKEREKKAFIECLKGCLKGGSYSFGCTKKCREKIRKGIISATD